jgi:hypothetical protein
MPGTNALGLHQPATSPLTDRKPARPQFFHHSWRAVTTLDLGMNRPDQCQQLLVREPLRWSATGFPVRKATGTYRQHSTQHCQRVGVAQTVNPGILHRDTFAKYAVAFSGISTSILSRAFSALSRYSSICSGVISLPPFEPGFPALLALRQFDRVCSDRPSSSATCAGLLPSLSHSELLPA